MKKNNKLFKCILIIIDIIAIILLVTVTEKWIDGKINSNKEQVVKYKKFTFTIPGNIKYQEIDEFKFSYETGEYKAIIEIIDNQNNFVFDDPDKFYEMLLEDGFKVGQYEYSDISDKIILMFNNYNDKENAKLCFFEMFKPFAVQVELYSKNGDYVANLTEIVDTLAAPEYDSDSNKSYKYREYMSNH